MVAVMRCYGIVTVAFVLSPYAAAQSATITVNVEGATPTQAVFSYDTLDSSACSVRVAEAGSLGGVVHDVDPAIFSGSDQDLSRPSTISDGTRRYVIIGARTSETGPDGKLYSRALQAATAHTFSVSCPHSAGALSFSTQNPPLGTTYPDVPPYNPAGFGNYAWPTVDWANPSKTYIDPMTGLLLKPAHAVNPLGQAGEWGNQPQEFPLTDVFDLNHAWSGTANLFGGTTSGPFATYAELIATRSSCRSRSSARTHRGPSRVGTPSRRFGTTCGSRCTAMGRMLMRRTGRCWCAWWRSSCRRRISARDRKWS